MDNETLNSGKVYVQSARTKIKKVGSIEKVNRLNNYHLHFHVEVIWEMLKRRNVQIGIASIVFLALSTVFVVNYTGNYHNKKIYEKYFDSANLGPVYRISGNIESISLYKYALNCCSKEKFEEAIPIFEGLISSNTPLKDICKWRLAGCYIATGEDDAKINKLLVEITQTDGRLSNLAFQVLEDRKKD